MTTALIVLLLVGLAVWASAARPSLGVRPTGAVDRDRERQLSELRALPCSRADVRVP